MHGWSVLHVIDEDIDIAEQDPHGSNRTVSHSMAKIRQLIVAFSFGRYRTNKNVFHVSVPKRNTKYYLS